MRTARWPWIRLGALSLACGLVTSVLVAWACALWAPTTRYTRAERFCPGWKNLLWPPRNVPESGWRVGVWYDSGPLDFIDGRPPVEPPYDPTVIYYYRDDHVAKSFDRLESEAGRARLAAEVRGGWGEGLCESIQRATGRGVQLSDFDAFLGNPDPTYITASEVRSGWPLLCLRGYGPGTAFGCANLRGGLLVVPWVPGPRPRRAMGRSNACPLIPEPLALVCDAVVHGAVILGLIGAGRSLRAACRRRTGFCAICAYDLRGLGEAAACPACGSSACGAAPHSGHFDSGARPARS